MSAKIMTAVAAAILLASTALASAQTQAPRHDRANGHFDGYYNVAPNGYYNVAPDGYATPNGGWNVDSYPLPY